MVVSERAAYPMTELATAQTGVVPRPPTSTTSTTKTAAAHRTATAEATAAVASTTATSFARALYPLERVEARQCLGFVGCSSHQLVQRVIQEGVRRDRLGPGGLVVLVCQLPAAPPAAAWSTTSTSAATAAASTSTSAASKATATPSAAPSTATAIPPARVGRA
jgi:hypothetical protein